MELRWVITAAAIAFLVTIISWPVSSKMTGCSNVTKSDRWKDPMFKEWYVEPRKEMSL